MHHRRTFLESRILELASANGIDISGLRNDGSLLARADADDDVQALAQIIRELRHALNDELIGMTARPIPAGTFDVVMRSAEHCRTLGEFVLELIAAAELMYSPPDLSFAIDRADGSVAIRYENAHRPEDISYFVYGFMVTHRGMSWLVDERIMLSCVQLRGDHAGQLDDLRHIFQCDVRLSQARNAIVFDAQYLRRPIRRGAGEFSAYLQRRPLDVLYLAGTDRSLSTRTIAALQACLQVDGVLPRLEDLAAVLGMPAYGLRRQLAR